MKRLFFIGALSVTSLISAKDGVEKNAKDSKERTQENVQKVKRHCVDVYTSCGKRGLACGETSMEILENSLILDEILCPSEEELGGL